MSTFLLAHHGWQYIFHRLDHFLYLQFMDATFDRYAITRPESKWHVVGSKVKAAQDGEQLAPP
jgi:hypothetical protein